MGELNGLIPGDGRELTQSLGGMVSQLAGISREAPPS